MIAGPLARLAADHAIKSRLLSVGGGKLKLLEHMIVKFDRLLTVIAQSPDKTLSYYQIQPCCQKIRLNPHI